MSCQWPQAPLYRPGPREAEPFPSLGQLFGVRAHLPRTVPFIVAPRHYGGYPALHKRYYNPEGPEVN